MQSKEGSIDLQKIVLKTRVSFFVNDYINALLGTISETFYPIGYSADA